uniref:Fibrinogen C-terminal domain-containing protein n=1 Tax=Hemiselmis tepida TaxID=464990 RepID=A0A7S0WCA3_9CRYP|mmetsp:Transcript_36710/g.93804  ORF Transcript_36710/g.93804 Transcript_36710/m.93804 type:complete len:425 (+) Transcript_36710:22-1296(+)
MRLISAALLAALLSVGEGTRSGGAPVGTESFRGVNLNKLYQKTGLTKESAGRSCGELLSMGMTDSGVYWIKPPGVDKAFQTYCDQKSFGGGWQMCYTSKYANVALTDETKLVYNSSKPYKVDGYASNCKYSPFNQLIYIYHAEAKCANRHLKKCKTFDGTSDEDEKAYFTYETTSGEADIHFTVAGNSGQNLVSPSVRLQYSELSVLRDRYNVAVTDETAWARDSVGREQFAGSLASKDEILGLWETEADKYDLQSRATDFWRGRGVAYKVAADGTVSTTNNWKYELVVCDEGSGAPFGLFMSGIEGDNKGCFKSCNHWCGDHTTDHYRAAWGPMMCNGTANEPAWCVGLGTGQQRTELGEGNDSGHWSTGVSFKENGHKDVTFKLVSVGMRYRVQIPRDRNSGEANPTDYQGAEVKTFPWNYT